MNHIDELLDIIKPEHSPMIIWRGVIISPPAIPPLTAREKWKTSNHERRWSLKYGEPYPNLKTFREIWEGFEIITNQ